MITRLLASLAAAVLVAWKMLVDAPRRSAGAGASRPAAPASTRQKTARRSRWWLWAAAAVAVPIVVALGGLVVIYSGIFDVAATRQHTPPVYWALITTLRQSVLARASHEVGPVPDLSGRARFERGLVLYDEHCLQCHGAPGLPMQPIGQSLTPAPSNLALTGREWSSREIFWTVKNGLKMTGMPAWDHHLSEDDMWSIVAFVKTMPMLSPAEYKRRRAELVLTHAHVEARQP